MKNKILYIILIATIIVISGYTIFSPQKSQMINELDLIIDNKCGEYSQGEVTLNNNFVKVLVSDIDCKRELGLSGVKALKDNEGMFFVFNSVGFYPFWMKEMLFPIDILWIGDDFKIVGIEKDVSPNTYPKSFGEKYLSRYVLEVSAPYSDKNNIKVGDKITFTKK